ncbi:MAG: hypothetical protein HY040_23510 [Planctomycetes bacterium]|nr:hypothetical protein [Planctomycetota bacterium]
MKNVLNVIVDMLTLMALCVAAIGHVLPWFDVNRISRFQGLYLTDFQQWHAERSGIALGVLGGLVALSLLINWGPECRRIINLLMFVSAFAALLFQLMIFSNFQFALGDSPRLELHDTGPGYGLSLIPTGVALFLSLLRMLWTMPPTRQPKALPIVATALPPENKVHPF